MIEPLHDTSARDTSISGAEGRLRAGISSRREKKRRLKQMVRDGRGGPGLTPKNLSSLSSFGVKTTSSSGGVGGVAPFRPGKTKKVSFSGAISTLNKLLKKKATLKKMVSYKGRNIIKPAKMSKSPKVKLIKSPKLPKLI